MITAGLALGAASFVLLTQAGGAYGLTFIVLGTLVMSVGLSPVFILTTDLIVSAAPPERAGAAAAVSETGAEFGGVLGIAILGSIGIAVYRGMMADAVPVGIPAAAAEAARDTLGGAAAAAAELPGLHGDALLSVAREAFAQGFELIVVISAVIAAGAAIMVLVLLPRQPAGGVGSMREPPSAEVVPNGSGRLSGEKRSA